MMEWLSEETVRMSPGGLILVCITMAGIGACVSHWVDERFGVCDSDVHDKPDAEKRVNDSDKEDW